ncbi:MULTISPECIES: siderophore-interacting protein [Streptomyces]|uniref:Siderophore-interacting protein n=1 Tax=Streptomyces tsukubensis (strain DSM 42081 / NBRC 108919 / NRRL 18488 / 9993) TaxID=1114943 RepID=A0A7G3UKS0_STRT9|nr:siderophore-interacting protein [Streptomyces tsukubensis]AZK93277.1 NADPH-dependent ferric siderophore reductase [Streptomyces tsukubensis]MYS63052.1 SIP domain-containing protein [Streptomyces sp. SID5473]QKM70568.1 siderophore-interacting protein [Streptomyces tsukubensis NRRL18488]TAI41336.1 siderophore-interacting protein [Streptomyces tsukubensis]
MTERPARKSPMLYEARVVHTERLTPHMVRLVFGGEGLAGFRTDGSTDSYVKLVFPAAGVSYPEPWDIDRIKAEFPREQWPSNRTYTVRAWDATAGELTVDFVVHGDEGLAGPWAAGARIGDPIRILGPGGGYAPDPAADWHLLAGDESALPAIAAALEQMPEGTIVHAFVEVEGPAEEQKIVTPDGVAVHWLHRGSRPVGEALVEAVTGLDFPEGRVCAFVHGEAACVKELRRHLRLERGIPREQLSISGYWRLGQSDEAWRAVKREWNDQVEREQEPPTSGPEPRAA